MSLIKAVGRAARASSLYGLVQRRVGLAPLALVVAATLVAACGSSGSSKPAYCSKISDLKSSVADLGKVKPVQNGASAVTSALDKVKSNADAAVAAAKSDFPSETSALRSAIDNLEKSAQRLKSSPVATITALPGQIQAAVSAVTNLKSATSSKCG
jgi:hypothetical protein